MPNTWKLAADRYLLDHAGLKAVLRPKGPVPGLRRIRLAWAGSSCSWPGPTLAVRTIQAAETRSFPIGRAASKPDHRLRTNLVDIQLNESSLCPVRIQVYWGSSRARQIDMEILATTSEQFERIEVLTWSEFRRRNVAHASQLLVRLGSHRGHWVGLPWPITLQSLIVPRDRQAACMSLDGREPQLKEAAIASPFRSPVVCYRPAGQRWSYIEMSHPEDCSRIVARRVPQKLGWGFGLFGLDIEKGVILRGRVRGAFVPRQRDTARADKLFREFATEPPHLSV